MTVSAAGRPRRFSDNSFELGLFSHNVHNGMAQLKVQLWDASFENSLRVSQLAEEAGFEFLLPLGRWRGPRDWPAEPEDMGGSFESLVWAGGVLAATRRIMVFGTLHVAYINPVFAAKQIVTAHHIGKGRFGLNVVSGTVARDFGMFGLVPNDHDTQYDYTEEWVTIAKRVWTENEPFDHDGTFFHLRDVISKPKPYGGSYPMLISAGHSHRGRAFAMRHADALFTSFSEIDTAPEEIRMARAAVAGGDAIPIYSSSHLVCRPTRKEADEWYRHLVYDLGAWEGIEEAVRKRTANRTLPYASIDRLKERLISGTGTFLVKGGYDDCAATYKALHDMGLNGIAVGMNDYGTELPVFCDEIMPRLERLGIRRPVHSACARA
jgi:alkanesulfonate monooxygenase SsuD/methylene tetrahydromethanopterin reductase-like flavin-dependent oxidoreductase (luciferase family)